MLGSNPSADSVASTDAGDVTASPFRCLLTETPYRERHQSVKSSGAGQGPRLLRRYPSFLLMHGRSLIMHRSNYISPGIFRYF